MSTTHCRDENEVFRSTAMSGSATVTMVTSTSSMNVPRHTAVSGIHLRIGMFLSGSGYLTTVIDGGSLVAIQRRSGVCFLHG